MSRSKSLFRWQRGSGRSQSLLQNCQPQRQCIKKKLLHRPKKFMQHWLWAGGQSVCGKNVLSSGGGVQKSVSDRWNHDRIQVGIHTRLRLPTATGNHTLGHEGAFRIDFRSTASPLTHQDISWICPCHSVHPPWQIGSQKEEIKPSARKSEFFRDHSALKTVQWPWRPFSGLISTSEDQSTHPHSYAGWVPPRNQGRYPCFRNW